MNDIVSPNLVSNTSQAQTPRPIKTGSKEFPKQEQTEVKQLPASRNEIEKAVVNLNDYLQKAQRDLEFSIDETTGSTIIKVTDRTSGEVIRQIPDVTLLELAKAAKEQEVLNLLQTTG